MNLILRNLAVSAAILLTFQFLQAGQSPNLNSTPEFFPNLGQITDSEGNVRPDIFYTTSYNGVKIFFQHNTVTYAFSESVDDLDRPLRGHRIDLNWLGANPNPVIEGVDEGSTYKNFYFEHCPNGITNVHGFSKIVYKELYDNIDVEFYFTQNGLKYDYVVHPGGDPNVIKFNYVGQDNFESQEDGSIKLTHSLGFLKESRPISFQDGKEIGPTSFFHVGGGSLFLIWSPWDHTKDLIIDPSVSWGTFFGGSGLEFTMLFGDIAADSSSSVYIASHTASTNFPVTTGAYQSTNAGGTQDAVAAKFDNTGSLKWSTYFGTSGEDIGSGCVLDSRDRMHFTGHTTGSNFPVTNGAFQTGFGGIQDAFVVTLDSSGALVRSTFLGGNGTDVGNRLAIDHDDNVFVVGATVSSNFPVSAGAFQGTNGGSNDFFIMKFDSSGARVFGSYYGGLSNDFGQDVGVDDQGNAYLVGAMGSTVVTHTGTTFQSSYAGGINDASISKWSPAGNMLWSTFYGGSADDSPLGIDCDSKGNVFFAGYTMSGNFPTTSGSYLQNKPNSSFAAYLVKFDSTGNRLWGTFFGGNTWERFWDINIGVNDEAYLTGDSRSSNYPLTNDAHQPTYGGGFNDAIIVKFDNNGGLVYSSFIGGNDQDNGRAIGIAADGSFFVVGNTKSTNFPVVGSPYQGSFQGNTDGFLYSFYDCPDLVGDLGMGDTSYVCVGNQITFSVNSGMDTVLWSTGGTNNSITVSNAGTYWVSVVDSGCYDSDTTYLVVQQYPTVSMTAGGNTTICEGTSVNLNATGGVTYKWYLNGTLIPGETSATHAATQAGNYTVAAYNEGGCSDSTTSPIAITVLPAPTLDIGNDTTVCPGDTVILTAPTFPSHTWCSGGSAQTLTVTQTGIYCLTVTDNNNCTKTDSIQIIVNSTPQSNFSYSISNQTTVQFTSSATGASSWAWDFGDGQTSTFQNPIHMYDSLLNFRACLTVTEATGLMCDHTFCDTVWLDPIAIDPILPSNAIDLYPNPANLSITMHSKIALNGDVEASLHDMTGKVLNAFEWEGRGERKKSIDVSALAEGSYLLRIRTSKGTLTKKFFIYR